MFAIPGLVLLLATDYFKPQEYVPVLAGLPLLQLFTALTLLGFAVDLRLGVSRVARTPQLVTALLFVGWCALTNVPNGPREVFRQTYALLIPFSLYLLIAHVVQTVRMLQVMMALVLAFGLAVAFIGTHQGFAPWGCHKQTYVQGRSELVYDGRPCAERDREACEAGADDPADTYYCEHVGLLGTQSIAGRVRFRGTMQDPNELALAAAIVMPMAFAFFDRRRTSWRLALLVGTVALAGLCAVFTRSRGGQIVFLVVLGIYFVKRFGLRGLAVGLACALPILLLGGREGADAAASTDERIEAWATGLRMLAGSPLLGVGLNRFTEHHYLTAHNSYLLTAAELGFPGMLLWSSVLYLSIKIPIQALRTGASDEPSLAPVARSWSLALAAALAGIVAGILFLSYAYKEVLWMYVGLSGALYQAIQRHEPSFRVRMGPKDVCSVAAMNSGFLLLTLAYVTFKLGRLP